MQGSTIKPLVSLLKVKRKNMEKSVNVQLFERMLDHYLAGVEATCGIHGHHWLRDKFEQVNTRFLKRILTRTYRNTPTSKSTANMRIVHIAQELAIKEAVQMARKGSFDNAQAMIRSASSSSLGRSPSGSQLHKMSSTVPHQLSTIVEERGSIDLTARPGQPTAPPSAEVEHPKREVRFIVADEGEDRQQANAWSTFYNDAPPLRRATLPVVITNASGDPFNPLETREAAPSHARARKVSHRTAVVACKGLALQAIGPFRHILKEDSDADLVQYYHQFKRDHAKELDEASRRKRETQRRQSIAKEKLGEYRRKRSLALRNKKTNKSTETESEEEHDDVAPTFILKKQSDTSSEGKEDRCESIVDESAITEKSPATNGIANPSFENDPTSGDNK